MSRSCAWNEPQRLVQSLGGKWDFQHSLDLGNLSSSICRHYHAWKDGTADPQSHPLFVCVSGCGTGKSRLLDEFPKLVKESEEHMDQEMKQLLQNAYTFKITFDNETKDNGGIMDPKKMLGTRMLYQLQNAVDWSVFSANPDNHVVPEEVLMKLSNITGRDLSQMCVILCVDSLHKVPHEPGHKDSQFSTAFASVCELINASKCFVIAICSSSRSQPVDESLTNSPQWSMKLETISLQCPTINRKSVF